MIRLPPDKRRGQPLPAADWNKVTAGLRSVLNMRGGNGVDVKVTSGGIVIGLAREGLKFKEPATFARAWNVGEETAYPLECAMLTWPWQLQGTPPAFYGQPFTDAANTGDQLTYFHARVLEARRPLDSCFGRFGVWLEKVEPRETGLMAIAGACLAYLTIAGTQGDYQLADRADTLAGQPHLQLAEVGGAQVLWYDPAWTNGDPFPALIRLEARNTMGVGINQDGDDTNRGVAEVLVFDDSVVLSYDDEKAGIVRVERVP